MGCADPLSGGGRGGVPELTKHKVNESSMHVRPLVEAAANALDSGMR